MSSQPETVASPAGDQLDSTFCCFVLFTQGSRVFLEVEDEVSAITRQYGGLFKRLINDGVHKPEEC